MPGRSHPRAYPLGKRKSALRVVLIRRTPSSPPHVEPNLLCAVVTAAQFAFEQVHVVLAVLAVRLVRKHADGVESGIAVAPHLEALYGADALDLAEAVSAAVDVGPDDINVEVVDHVSSPHIALELDGPLDRGKLVSHLYVLVVDADPLIGRVANAVRLGKGEISFHVRGVMVLAVARVERMRVNLRRDVRRHCSTR